MKSTLQLALSALALVSFAQVAAADIYFDNEHPNGVVYPQDTSPDGTFAWDQSRTGGDFRPPQQPSAYQPIGYQPGGYPPGGPQRPFPPQAGPQPYPQPGGGNPYPGHGGGYPGGGYPGGGHHGGGGYPGGGYPGGGYPGPQPYPPQPYPNPGPQPNYIQVQRFLSPIGSHFWTLDANEGYRAGFQYEGVGFQTMANPGYNSHQIFRCFTGASHFISVDGNCEGQRFEGSLGWVGAQPSPQTPQELVRCFNGRFHLITTNRNECYQAGYNIEGVLGYVR